MRRLLPDTRSGHPKPCFTRRPVGLCVRAVRGGLVMKLVASEWYVTYEPRHDSSDRLGDARCYLKWTLRDLAQSLKRTHESVLITCGDDLNGAAFEARKRR